jgi:hypothetical protein
MSNSSLDPQLIADKIAEARDRKAHALIEYEAAAAELEWWLKGAELAGVAVSREEDEPTSAEVEELFPDATHFEQTGTKPTLRQAIMAHLREHPATELSVAELAQALVRRGWVPKQGAHKRVSDLAGLMHSQDQLQRVGRGVYRLNPRFAVAFERQPKTDYRRAAELGMPVPGSWPGQGT